MSPNEWALTHPATALEALVGGLQGREKVQRAAALRAHRSRSLASLIGADLARNPTTCSPFQHHHDGGAAEGDPEHAAETNPAELQIVMKARIDPTNSCRRFRSSRQLACWVLVTLGDFFDVDC